MAQNLEHNNKLVQKHRSHPDKLKLLHYHHNIVHLQHHNHQGPRRCPKVEDLISYIGPMHTLDYKEDHYLEVEVEVAAELRAVEVEVLAEVVEALVVAEVVEKAVAVEEALVVVE